MQDQRNEKEEPSKPYQKVQQKPKLQVKTQIILQKPKQQIKTERVQEKPKHQIKPQRIQQKPKPQKKQQQKPKPQRKPQKVQQKAKQQKKSQKTQQRPKSLFRPYIPKTVGQSKKQIKEQEQDLFISAQPLTEQQIEKYFSKIRIKNGMKASSATNIIETLVNMSIQNGEIQMDIDQEKQRQTINKYLIQKKIKTEDNDDPKKKIQMNLQYLHMQLSRVQNEEDYTTQFSSVFSKRKHKQFLTKISRGKVQLEEERKRKEQWAKSKEKQQEEIKKRQQQELDGQKLEKKKKILQKLEQQKKLHEKRLEYDEENNKRLCQIKQSKRLYEKMEEKFQSEVVLPSLEEKKKKLKQLREFQRAFDVQDIKTHEKQYLKARQKSLQNSQAKKEMQWEYKRPQKSHRLAKILERQKIEAEERMLEKKRKLEDKLRRQVQFATKLKERQPPKVDLKKKKQLQKRLQVVEKPQKPDKNELGMNYLQQMKKMRKKSSNTEFYRRQKNTASQTKTNKANTNYLYTSDRNKDYSNIKIKRVDKLLQSEDYDARQKIRMLQIQAERLTEETKRKEEIGKIKKENNDTEAVELMLASIKAKMGIIEVFNKN